MWNFFYTICIFKDILKEREREKKIQIFAEKLHSICMYLLTLYEEELRIRNRKILVFLLFMAKNQIFQIWLMYMYNV